MRGESWLKEGDKKLRFFKEINGEWKETPTKEIKKGDVLKTNMYGIERHSSGGLLPAMFTPETLWRAMSNPLAIKEDFSIEMEQISE